MAGLPRRKVIQAVKELLKDEGSMNHRQIAFRLYKRGDLYVVFNGERETVSAYALERQLKLSSEVVQNEEGDWRISSFAFDDSIEPTEKGSEGLP